MTRCAEPGGQRGTSALGRIALCDMRLCDLRQCVMRYAMQACDYRRCRMNRLNKHTGLWVLGNGWRVGRDAQAIRAPSLDICDATELRQAMRVRCKP